ncbi:MAG: CarD family transcriptional regulator [Tissierellia bacterium]|nr:CarD family transcriptional regulator [Tissierellia bacterium]MDD4781761.1 CarD family transcriptional regulator [Tissierellia bacterium]
MFQVNDLIVYGNEGVCSVKEITTLDIAGIDNSKLYYVLNPLYHDGTIYSPVDTNVSMRKVITYEMAQQFIDEIPSIKVEKFKNSNLRELNDYYKSYFINHNCEDLLQLIKTVYEKKSSLASCGKKLGQTDENYMKKAEDLLYGEFSVALNISKEEVKDYIGKRVEELESLNENVG